MPQDYPTLAKRFGGTTLPHESDDAAIPLPELRIKDAIGVQVTPGNRSVSNSDAIASVGEHEPHKVEINDPGRFAQGPQQIMGHELVHLLFNNLPGPLQKAIPPDNPNHPYDISNVDELRKQGKRLWQLPQEQAAMVVQRWIANPADRKRLQPWIDDMIKVPLSVEEPTSPDAKKLNMTPRAPLPPIEAYQQMADIVKEAKQRRPIVPPPAVKTDYADLVKQYGGVTLSDSLRSIQKDIDTTLAAPPVDTGWRGEVERYGQGVAQGLTFPVVHPLKALEGLVIPQKGTDLAVEAAGAAVNPVQTAGQLTGMALTGKVTEGVPEAAQSFGESLKTTEPEGGYLEFLPPKKDLPADWKNNLETQASEKQGVSIPPEFESRLIGPDGQPETNGTANYRTRIADRHDQAAGKYRKWAEEAGQNMPDLKQQYEEMAARHEATAASWRERAADGEQAEPESEDKSAVVEDTMKQSGHAPPESPENQFQAFNLLSKFARIPMEDESSKDLITEFYKDKIERGGKFPPYVVDALKLIGLEGRNIE